MVGSSSFIHKFQLLAACNPENEMQCDYSNLLYLQLFLSNNRLDGTVTNMLQIPFNLAHS